VNQLIIQRTCRLRLWDRKKPELKENDGNAQFSLCCTSTAMPDDES